MKETPENVGDLIAALKWANSEKDKVIRSLARDNDELRRKIREATQKIREITNEVA